MSALALPVRTAMADAAPPVSLDPIAPATHASISRSALASISRQSSISLRAYLLVPFSITKQNLRYVTTMHGQFTNDTPNYIDDRTTSSHYTVRGFDGETMPAAERGLYWRDPIEKMKSPSSARACWAWRLLLTIGLRRSE